MKAAHALRKASSLQVNSFNVCCCKNSTKVLVRYSATVGYVKYKSYVPAVVKIRQLGLGPTTKDFEEPTQITGPLTKGHATELVLRLNDEERSALYDALQEYKSQKIKEEYEGISKPIL